MYLAQNMILFVLFLFEREMALVISQRLLVGFSVTEFDGHKAKHPAVKHISFLGTKDIHAVEITSSCKVSHVYKCTR